MFKRHWRKLRTERCRKRNFSTLVKKNSTTSKYSLWSGKSSARNGTLLTSLPLIRQPSQASTKTNKFPCEEDGCGKSFSSGKDLRRHTLSVHTVDQQQYTCRCRFKSPRKDNYLRHLKSRTCSYNSGEPNFICVCGLGSRTRDDIVNLVALCVKRMPGRPA